MRVWEVHTQLDTEFIHWLLALASIPLAGCWIGTEGEDRPVWGHCAGSWGGNLSATSGAPGTHTQAHLIRFHRSNQCSSHKQCFLSSPSSHLQFQVTNPAVTGFRLSGEGREDLKISADGWLYLDKPLDWSKEDNYILMVKWVSFS